MWSNTAASLLQVALVCPAHSTLLFQKRKQVRKTLYLWSMRELKSQWRTMCTKKRDHIYPTWYIGSAGLSQKLRGVCTGLPCHLHKMDGSWPPITTVF